MSMGRAILKKMVMNDKGKVSPWKIGGQVLNGYFAVSDYSESRNQGNGVISSAASAAGDLAMGALMGPVGYMVATSLPDLARGAVDAYDALDQYGRQLQKQRRNVPFQNATFVDSQQTYTMRQAGMNLARQGQMAAQQTSFGNEAASVSYMGS